MASGLWGSSAASETFETFLAFKIARILYVKVLFDVGFLDQIPATFGKFLLCFTGKFDDLLDRIRMLERQERDLMCLQGFLGDFQSVYEVLSDLQMSRLL